MTLFREFESGTAWLVKPVWVKISGGMRELGRYINLAIPARETVCRPSSWGFCVFLKFFQQSRQKIR